MAKQYRKIKRKLTPKQNEPAPAPKNKGKDWLLVSVIAFTAIVLVFGWPKFQMMDRAMYILLGLALVLTYVHKHVDLDENAMKWVDRVSLTSIAAAVCLFIGICYRMFTQM